MSRKEHIMTLGEKIKKYRLMKNLTQKDLGIKVGFSAATADSRIRKYEKDIIVEKANGNFVVDPQIKAYFNIKKVWR